MQFDATLAEVRFGYGLSPLVRPPENAGAMLGHVAGPDVMGERFPVGGFDQILAGIDAYRTLQRTKRRSDVTAERDAAEARMRQMRKGAKATEQEWLRMRLLRRVWTECGFHERLVTFWADHFAAVGKRDLLKWAAAAHIESDIRPLVAGRFVDLLLSAILNPMMLSYLDQVSSVGPNSDLAKRKPGKGLNENLAREILELHSLGVDGPYGQDDVRQLAELLTGLGISTKEGVVFNRNRSEPGAETVLGTSYGGARASITDIEAVLRDIAAHPATARHIAQKLAVHFVSDTPDETLVAALEQRFLETKGDLMAVYQVLLEHPASWGDVAGNFKRPAMFVSSALRALAVTSVAMSALSRREFGALFMRTSGTMGQHWDRPPGPDGWSEADGHWITPQGMAARLQWAMTAPQALMTSLPDPRDFVQAALGNRASEQVHFAAEAAENRLEGVALVLMSPSFQRM
jgi:uncharacterized protein (DUF1800 family)